MAWVCACRDGTARLYDATTATCLAVLSGHEDSVSSVAFGLEGNSLATASLDATAKIWDLATATCMATLVGHAGAVRGVAWRPGGQVGGWGWGWGWGLGVRGLRVGVAEINGVLRILKVYRKPQLILKISQLFETQHQSSQLFFWNCFERQ